jgi:hypothetical protein
MIVERQPSFTSASNSARSNRSALDNKERAIAIVLDLMHPVGAPRRLIDRGRKLGLNEPEPRSYNKHGIWTLSPLVSRPRPRQALHRGTQDCILIRLPDEATSWRA